MRSLKLVRRLTLVLWLLAPLAGCTRLKEPKRSATQAASCLGDQTAAQSICGPFSAEATSLCRQWGGGDGCGTNRWDRQFYASIVASMSKPEDNCVTASGDLTSYRCGPFPQALIDKCLAEEGGDVCVSSRWSKALFERLSEGVRITSPRLPAQPAASNDPVQAIQSSDKHVFDVPILSQPTSNTCGPTSLAMVLKHFGRNVSIPELNARVPSVRQNPTNNSAELRSRGLHTAATSAGTRELMMKHLLKNRPIILHTYLTASGHVVVVTGFDRNRGGFYINDSWGVYQGGKYHPSYESGKDIFVAWSDPNLMVKDGDIWITIVDDAPFDL